MLVTAVVTGPDLNQVGASAGMAGVGRSCTCIRVSSNILRSLGDGVVKFLAVEYTGARLAGLSLERVNK
jgi:hypothetical protein